MPDDGTNAAPDAEALDINAILSGTSDSSDTTTESVDGTTPQGAAKEASEFRFGGRSYKTQQDAEKAHNALYGKYSQQQSVLNQLKAALKDPKKLAVLARDPEWSTILAKLGIQEAQEEYDADEEAEAAAGRDYSKLPVELQGFVHDQKVQAASLVLDREEWAFERKLGRSVTAEEHNSVMEIIGRAQNLTYEEAYKLANHDRMLTEAGKKAAAQGQTKPNGERPPPHAAFIPGVKMDLKKPLTQMSKAEAREHLRQSDEFKNLMSR